jgi:carbon monoxide dehydrogenase subunit G
MRIENSFTVAASPDDVWAYLLDVERVVPCMPGAELTETIDHQRWKGRVNIAFGPVKMAFSGTVAIEERDDDALRVKLRAKGTEQKGKGAANASVTSWLEPAEGGGTRVQMEAELTLTGAVAQLSRGLLPEISKKLTHQFADCLQMNMSAEGAPGTAPGATPPRTEPTAAAPVGAVRMALSALWAGVGRFLRRLSGRRDTKTGA